jgi:hypothetical protein
MPMRPSPEWRLYGTIIALLKSVKVNIIKMEEISISRQDLIPSHKVNGREHLASRRKRMIIETHPKRIWKNNGQNQQIFIIRFEKNYLVNQITKPF